VGKEFNNADKGKTFKQGGDMKKMNMGGYADGGMPMVNKGGKMVPSFAADGKGKMAGGGMAKPKMMASGGSASKRADGIAVKGKTKGTMLKHGGKVK
jgi:hypothetical protein